MTQVADRLPTEAALRVLVDRFYARVRDDDLLGPVFNDAVHDWPAHLATLTDFWSSIMLTSGQYKGNPMAAHLKHVARIEPRMFERWLDLWRETAGEMLPEGAAKLIAEKADRIAQSLQLGLFFRIGRDGRATC